MQAITTKILPATNTKPTRIKATCARGSITVGYDHSRRADSDENHRAAVDALVARFLKEDATNYGTKPEANPWGRKYATGTLPNGDYCHVYC